MCSTLAVQLPLTIKDPDKSKSPFFFKMASGSPVIKASFTSTSPSIMIESATIWWPTFSMVTSSKTSSFNANSSFFPSRIVVILDSEITDRRSIIFLEIISSIILIMELMIITPINKQFFNPSNHSWFIIPAIKTEAPKAIFKKLKYVKIFVAIILLIDFVLGWSSKFTNPSFFLRFTCSCVKP